MATAAEISLPAEEFALWETFTRIPDVVFDVERVVAHGEARVMPILWASGAELDEISDAFDADPSVEDEELLVDLNDEWLYRMAWVDDIAAVVQSLVYEEGTITDAHGRNDRWSFRIVFPDSDALSRTYQFCQEEDLTMEIESVTQMESEPGTQFGLSEVQYTTLITAHREGYFEVPRETTVEELAEKLDVSAQSVSERLRRGHEKLISSALPTAVEEASDDE
ncbi:helix-turn-helix domain-containing protein [Halomicroarcula limicola]|uniref:Helix-turn-helix domain-containing protein n=1 Tax=Haloarcula limicola TaxID=1429915 RepID=A0A8J7YCK2_9EURY|nr:helix-turn-helix domain-containing protein [Halomicroarcula limicola]MBV0926161.1 helix-turn-helix domain-containing protein [Halomicroarcula limicola]